MQRRFAQLDVFTTVATRGNALAVVIDGDGVGDAEMARFANWTNLSETTFLLPPTDPAADYCVRIFTPTGELPFAGHPTIGSCRAWLEHGGAPASPGTVVQECGVGLVTLRHAGDQLAFAAPPRLRSGPVDDELRTSIERVIGCPVVDASWADNGPGWVAAEVADSETLLAIEPDFSHAPDLKLGLVASAPSGAGYDVDVRAFYPGLAGSDEDPVTGSLNASIAQWLMERDPTIAVYTARQGTALGRDGRVHISRDADGTIWVGGGTVTVITGTVSL